MSDIVSLQVHLHATKIGTLTRLPNDQNLFAFDTAYVDNPSRPTLSLSFKDAFGALLTAVLHTQTRLPPFFSNLLPEGSLRDYLAQRAHVFIPLIDIPNFIIEIYFNTFTCSE
jgi:serine/threonine-protein kinase HipA